MDHPWFTNTSKRLIKTPKQSITPWLIHGGTTRQDREKATVLPRNDLSPLLSILNA